MLYFAMLRNIKTPMSNELLDREALIFKALGHPTRLKIVRALAEGEKCVCQLQSLTHSSLSTVSRHLSVLREAGVIASRKEGVSIYCSLCLPCIAAMLACLESPPQSGCSCRCGCREST